MSTTPENPPAETYHEIDPTGDLTIKVVQYNMRIRGDDGKHPILKMASMKVCRKTILDNCDSKPFKAMLGGVFLEGRSGVITLKEDDIASVELWLRCFHDVMNDACYAISVEEVWNALAFGQKYLMDFLDLKDWFEKYWSRIDKSTLTKEVMRQLLYPAYAFDSAKAFAQLTQVLTYTSSDHITEYNPTAYRSLHLDGNVIGSINGAKGTLRNKLIRGLFDPVSAFLKQTCTCKAQALFNYNMGLSKTGLWPLHEQHKKSVQEILDSPGMVKFQCEVPAGACPLCKSRTEHTSVESVRENVVNHFDGLCLDCMKMTKQDDVDDDYWEHDRKKEWSVECRIVHKQPTWYFSFMGRKTDMARHQKKKKDDYDTYQHFRYF